MVLMMFMDSPGVVSNTKTNTYPQYAFHISIEGNNTYVCKNAMIINSTPTIVLS